MPTDLRAFRPTVWADEFSDLFRQQPGLLDYITRFDDLAATAGRGETIKIPALTLDGPQDITPGTDATLANVTDGTVDLKLDKFRGHLLQVTPQDIRFAHPDARRATLAEVARLQKNDANSIILDLVDDAAVTQEVNTGGGALTDADILAAKKFLDDAEFPAEDRILAVPTDGENDLLGITTYISRDFGEGQGQNQVPMVRGFQVVSLPSARFNYTTGPIYSAMAFHKSAIAAAVAPPHMRLVERGGKFDTVIEMGAIWGLTIRKASGIVRVLR